MGFNSAFKGLNGINTVHWGKITNPRYYKHTNLCCWHIGSFRPPRLWTVYSFNRDYQC